MSEQELNKILSDAIVLSAETEIVEFKEAKNGYDFDKTTQNISFIEIYELNKPEGRVILFQIPAAPQGIPVAYEGFYYGRANESLVALNIEKIERIRNQAINREK